MSLKHALLGFINIQSMTGYQLKKYFDESVGIFWSASLSQIYPTLNQMSHDGMLTVEIITQDLSPNAKKYSITEAGREELLGWLKGELEPDNVRSELLMRLFFSSNISDQQVVGQLKGMIEKSKQKLLICQGQKKHIEEEHLGKSDMMHEPVFWSFAADYGIRHEEFIIDWCEACIQKLSEIHWEGEKEI